MATPPRHVRMPPFTDTLPAPIYFRAVQVPADTIYPWHCHQWGEFVYSFSGVMEVKLADSHYLAPPQYGIWLPARVEHIGQNRLAAEHSSLYIAEELCGALPKTTCALAVSPLVRAMLEHLRQHPPGHPRSASDERLLRVLVDQLATAQCVGSYLPMSDDPLLAAVLGMLEADPADNRSVAELAQAANTTERTLMRRCQRELGMTLADWRQRLRVVRAMALLETGQTVEAVALDLGYASASAFIAMFRRLTSETPDEYRKRATHAHT
ncbi:helix-turn-helix domain-containing protein [Duganella sp. FT92W]|uniref:Helix-turn-helix domain-containing protein n=1 Tax=Pseudoduganella rivuli TaxID=2666085 RepID=A0A7X2IPJ9_9BURK|nr:helix-turn-helix transcriptional regulator [Pseudoduganella rivuli]MRV73690.1 helix-turn-helix domain-containing protein [Pseudoduganella rivuli]